MHKLCSSLEKKDQKNWNVIRFYFWFKYITNVLSSSFNFHNRKQFEDFVLVRPFWIKNIPTSYMLVKSPKTLFVKNFSVVWKLSTVFTVSAVKTSLCDFHFNFKIASSVCCLYAKSLTIGFFLHRDLPNLKQVLFKNFLPSGL